MTGEHYPQPEPQEASGRQSEEPGVIGAEIMQPLDSAVADAVSSALQPPDPFERAFPTFYGTEVTRGFRPALEQAIARERAKRESQSQR